MVPTTSPSASDAEAGRVRRPVFHPLRVAAVDPLCEDAAAVSFETPGHLAEQYTFAPGQSLTLRRVVDGREQRRSYSVCSPVGGAPRIGVRVIPGGLFSDWLVNEVRPGDTIEVLPPAGAFTPDLGTPAHHVLIAAGSGITPMLSIAASVLGADETSTITLFYGNRRTDTVMFAEEIADLKDRHMARFQLVHVLSREARETDALCGRLDADRLALLIDALVPVDTTDHWWLCGPQGMVSDAQRLLTSRGVPGERVHRELFFAHDAPLARSVSQAGAGPDAPTSQVMIILDGRSSRLALPRDVSILDGAQRARPDLPFACKGGVCGTCRARITEGEADLRRNYALEDREIAAGYVLTCQTFPVSETLTVDFDS